MQFVGISRPNRSDATAREPERPARREKCFGRLVDEQRPSIFVQKDDTVLASIKESLRANTMRSVPTLPAGSAFMRGMSGEIQ